MSPRGRRAKSAKPKASPDWLSLSGLFLLLLGALTWLLARYLIEGRSGWGVWALGIENWSLKLHGTGVMLFFLGLGRHWEALREYWKGTKKGNRPLLLGIYGLLALLILSGWLLYYGPTSDLQDEIMLVHWILGILLLLAISAYLAWRSGSKDIKKKLLGL